MLARGYELLLQPNEMRQLAQHCYEKLHTISSPLNFEKMLKIYYFPVLSTLSPKNASNYLDFISMLPVEVNSKNYSLAYERLRNRITEDSVASHIGNYFDKLPSIESYIR